MSSKNFLQKILLSGLALGVLPAVSSAGCLDCHQTTVCQTPTKPEGTCADCHLGDTDLNDFQSNFITAMLDSGQWLTTGHGKPGISLDCDYCHDYDIRHGETTNPFRLANTSAAGAAGQNTNCLICHGTDAAGFDPDGPADTFSSLSSTVKIDENHVGNRHNQASDGGHFCWDCHDPHGDDNIAMVHNEVSQQSDGQYGIPVLTKATDFIANATGTDYARSTPPYSGICQVCHTATNHYTNASGDGHNADRSCTVCHEHNEGFQPNCISCHGYPPVTNMPGGEDGMVIIPEETGALSSGAHVLHATASGYGYSCGTCHFDGMPVTAIIDNYQLQMGFAAHGFSGDGSIYNGQILSSAYSYEPTNGTVLGSGEATTCENLYCHSDGTAVSTSFADPTTYNGPHQASPSWTGSTSCTSCHSYPPDYAANAPKANVHERHVNLFTYGDAGTNINYNENPCHICHYSTTTDGATITNRSNHVNRHYDLAADPTATFLQNLQTPKAINFTYEYGAGGGTCSNISCHEGILSGTLPWGYDVYIDAGFSWLPSTACGELGITISNVTMASTNSTISPSEPFTYFFDWESDGIWDYIGDQASQSHVYPETTSQYITYSVQDAAGRTFEGGSKTTPAATPSTVNGLPVVSVSTSVNGSTVTLTDHSTDADYNSCGHEGLGRARIVWGDGVTEIIPFDLTDQPSGAQFTHTYTGTGTFYIRYYVYDNVITYPVAFNGNNIRIVIH